jgi:HEAT repeat protein
MSTTIRRGSCLAALMLIVTGPSFGQNASSPAKAKGAEAELIAVLKSSASREEKATACRKLALIGTRESVPALAALLGDEALGHMARYALEPIPDPAVDTALRDALAKLKGRLLVGVIGSISVRRDAGAVERLTGLLKDGDAEVARTAAKALGRIGTDQAVKALESGLAAASPSRRLAFYEGLFRGADALAASGRTADALAVYSKLAAAEAPPQVRGGAARKVRILSQEQAKGL